MTEYNQVPFDASANAFAEASEFAENAEQRCPCVLVLDTSGSMQGEPIAQLNSGIQEFKNELMGDELASKRVEVAVITFGPTRVVSDFKTADVFQPMHLSTTGDTPMGSAIMEAVRLVEERKQTYQHHGVPYNRPWIFLITDGAPTDDVTQATQMVHAGVAARKFTFFAVGVQGANMTTLGKISPRPPVKLSGLRFRELFQWLSNSLGAVSRSSPNAATVAIAPPTGWTEV